MNESGIFHLGFGEVDVEYKYNHREKRERRIELIRVANLQEPEKHMRDETQNILKAQIHHFEYEKKNMELREITGGI